MPEPSPLTSRTERRLESMDAAAAYVGVHPRTLRRWCRAGRLTAYRVGPRLVRVDLDEVEALLVPVPTRIPADDNTTTAQAS